MQKKKKTKKLGAFRCPDIYQVRDIIVYVLDTVLILSHAYAVQLKSIVGTTSKTELILTMEAYIMSVNIIFSNCTGVEFENWVVKLFQSYNFDAKKTGKSDGGVDIIVTVPTTPKSYSFNIQCKYYNTTLGKAPIQEVFTGTYYYGNGAKPVVITNNRVTADARIYAKRLGVEIIADAEWLEIKQVYKTKKIINPNPHKGLMGILLAYIVRDKDYLNEAVKDTPKIPSDHEVLKLELINNFDEAEEYIKEAARLQQAASQCQQRALTLQKEALIKNLGYD